VARAVAQVGTEGLVSCRDKGVLSTLTGGFKQKQTLQASDIKDQ